MDVITRVLSTIFMDKIYLFIWRKNSPVKRENIAPLEISESALFMI